MIRIHLRPLQTIVFCMLLGMSTTLPSFAGDEDIFSAQVPPNVVLLMDNSGSMNTIMEHPSYEPGFTHDCDIPVNENRRSGTVNDESDPTRSTDTFCAGGSATCDLDFYRSDASFTRTSSSTDHEDTGFVTRTFCGQTRRLYLDGEATGPFYSYKLGYAEWLFNLDPTDNTTLYGPAGEERTAAQILAELDADNTGREYISGDFFPAYQISRITAARNIASDVIYQTNTDCPAFTPGCTAFEDRVRFGLAQFASGSHGGFIRAPIDSYGNNRLELAQSIETLEAGGGTPLAESLFKIYTYFMPRDETDRPFGDEGNGSTRFPEYLYNITTGWPTSRGNSPDDPVTDMCQKNFVIMVTDGQPSSDNFGVSGNANRTRGFEDFAPRLIGDYFTDPTDSILIPETGGPWGSSGSGYLDDIALYMQQNDFRPDFPDETNTIDTYTVGFATDGIVNDLLTLTANNGNGLFFNGNQADDLTEALVSSIQDIISKSQGFSAATVPAARTSDGGNLYTTLFQPTSVRPFWPGLIRSYRITGSGEILDRDGNCALTDLVDPNFCAGGTFLPEDQAPPFWNASKEMPAANDRNLRVSIPAAGFAQAIVGFDHGLEAAELGGALGAISSYPPSANVTTAAVLDEAVVAFLAGCEWGTGLTSGGGEDFQNCVDRTRVEEGSLVPDRLGDIFHSNPVVAGAPRSFINEESYRQFSNIYSQRDRVIYFGANDGFLHGMHAGDYDTSTNQYDAGTGVELFGFMPWGARGDAMNLAKDDATLHPLSVDGSPTIADVWIDSDTDPNNPKLASDWRTTLIMGMREGAEHYLAMDITDPSAANYPSYLWEFPIEADTFWRDRIAQTWSEPVITRIRMRRPDDEVEEVWVAIVGFGYDPTGDPNNQALYNINAVKGRGIMMINVETGRPIAVRRFGTGTGQVPDMHYAIPSSPAVLDLDQDGFADVLYVGDLGGNVWKWEFRTPGDIDNNGVPSLANLHQPNWSFRKFFDDDPTRAVNARARSFYFSPSATLVNGILHLGFGSGERSDLNCSSTLNGCVLRNRFYVVRDRDVRDLGTLAPIDGRSVDTESGDLTDVTALEETCPATEPKGYFFQVGDGEKFVTNSDVFNSFFFVSTFNPDLSDACEPNGQSELYGFLARCGQGFFGPPSTLSPIAGTDRKIDIGKGLPTDPRISIAPGDGGNRLIIGKQNGELINIDAGRSDAENGLIYWREVN